MPPKPYYFGGVVMYTCYWEERYETLEYAPREGYDWYVVAYDRKYKPMLMQQNLDRAQAEYLALEWANRNDVVSVKADRREA